MKSGAATLRAHFSGRIGGLELDAAFEAPLRGVTALFGASGAGKTVLLRCIAGLSPLRGQLWIGEQAWEDATSGQRRATHERAIGYVFQEPSLFDHLSVRDNLLYGYRRGGRSRPAPLRPEEVVALLGIEPLLHRSPRALSGGERQRVSIGRALLSQPELLLMDEPLAALDHDAKDEILRYLERVQRSLSIPLLYVTHDLREVERLADHLVLLEHGRVVASGPLHDVLTDPRTALARGSTAATLLEAEVVDYDAAEATSRVRCGSEDVLVPGACGPVGTRLRLHIAAADVSLALDPPLRTTILNVIPARIAEIALLDAGRANVIVTLGGTAAGPRLLARVTQRSIRALSLQVGQRAFAQIKAASIVNASEASSEATG